MFRLWRTKWLVAEVQRDLGLSLLSNITTESIKQSICETTKSARQLISQSMSQPLVLQINSQKIDYSAILLASADPSGRSLEGIAGSNPADGTDVCLL